MQHQELARHLSVNPSEIVYAVTMETVLSAIVNRMGDEALFLTVEEIDLAKEEIKAAIDHTWASEIMRFLWFQYSTSIPFAFATL